MVEKLYKEFSAVVPAYNEAKRFGKVVASLLQIKELKQLILVDDGSTDDTNERAKEFLHDKRFIYIKHFKNKGKGSALRTGVNKAKTEVILFIDADLENITPQKIMKIVTPVLEDEVDLSRGTFKLARGRVTEIAVKPMMRILFPDLYFEQPISGQICGKKSFLKSVDWDNQWGVDIGILLDAISDGQRIVEVDIGKLEHKSRSNSEKAEMAQQVLETMIKKAGLIQHKYKLVVFTLDDTLIKSREINKLFKKLSIYKEIESIRDDFNEDKISFEQYLIQLAATFKDIASAKLEEVGKEIKFENYALEVIKAVQTRRYQVAILSSHFSPVVRLIASKLGVDNVDCIKLVEKDGVFTGEIAKDSKNHWVGKDDQQAFMESFLKVKNRAKVRSRETIMVANSDKAIPLLEKVGLGIAYKPKDAELKAIAEKTIHVLPELLAIIE